MVPRRVVYNGQTCASRVFLAIKFRLDVDVFDRCLGVQDHAQEGGRIIDHRTLPHPEA